MSDSCILERGLGPGNIFYGALVGVSALGKFPVFLASALYTAAWSHSIIPPATMGRLLYKLLALYSEKRNPSKQSNPDLLERVLK